MLCENIWGNLKDIDTTGKKIDYVESEWDEAFKRIHKKVSRAGKEVGCQGLLRSRKPSRRTSVGRGGTDFPHSLHTAGIGNAGKNPRRKGRSKRAGAGF